MAQQAQRSRPPDSTRDEVRGRPGERIGQHHAAVGDVDQIPLVQLGDTAASIAERADPPGRRRRRSRRGWRAAWPARPARSARAPSSGRRSSRPSAPPRTSGETPPSWSLTYHGLPAAAAHRARSSRASAAAMSIPSPSTGAIGSPSPGQSLRRRPDGEALGIELRGHLRPAQRPGDRRARQRPHRERRRRWSGPRPFWPKST